MPPPAHLKRGAKPSPRHRLLAAEPHRVVAAPPAAVAYVPPHLDMWGNQDHGDCVSAEEAFAKACYSPEIFIPEQTVIAWAAAHGVLEGASLIEVLDAMQNDGFVVGGQRYNDGPPFGVDYANQTVLQSALAAGPVKIAIDANALPSGTGVASGWFATGQGNWPNTDHCVSVAGYGPAGWLYQQLNLPLPATLSPNMPGYLVYSWKTIGFVDHPWVMGTCVEGWVRNPTTVGVPPLQPGPGPGPAPAPKVLFTFTPRRSVPVHGSVTLANLPVPLKGGVAYPVLDPAARGAPFHDPMQDVIAMLQASLTKMDYMRGTVNNTATVLDYTRQELAALTRADTSAPTGEVYFADALPGS